MMNSIVRKITGIFLITSTLLWAQAQNAYVELPERAQQIKTSDPKEVEVVEVFSYLCGHCYQVEVPVNKWLKEGKAEGVNFVRVPLPGNGVLENLAKAYYTLEAMNKVAEGHPAIYKATMVDRVKSYDKNSLAKYLEKNAGIDSVEFLKVWDSFPVTANYNRALDLVANQYKIAGTPTFIVDGKYLIDGETARVNSYDDFVTAVDEVSKKELAKKQASLTEAE